MTATPTVATVTVVSTLAYLGLAVLGWGGFASSFSHPPLMVLSVAPLVLPAVALFSPGTLSSADREDRSNRWVLAAFALIGLRPAIYRLTPTGSGSGHSMEIS